MEKKQKIKFNILAVVVIILFAFAVSPITMQNDTYYTVKIGELIVNNGIDMQDHFSWHENLPYTYPHWLYDVMIYLIYNFWGFAGIYVSTIILASVLGITIYGINNKLSKNNFVSLVISLIVLYLLKDFIAARACNFYIICTYYSIYRNVYRNKEKKIFNPISNNSNSNSKCACCSMAFLLYIISAIYSRVDCGYYSKSKYYN